MKFLDMVQLKKKERKGREREGGRKIRKKKGGKLLVLLPFEILKK